MADDFQTLIDTPVPDRRGATATVMGGWHYLLTEADPDAVLDALIADGTVGAARRDCAAAVLAGEVPRPMGEWGMLVRLRGQRWTYVLGDGLRKEWARQWAARHGWRTAMFIVGDLPASTVAAVNRGGDVEAELLCGFFKELPEGFEIQRPLGDDRATVRGSADIATRDWLDGLRDEADALDAFARWAEAYLPVALMHTTDDHGNAEVWGRDGDPYPGDNDGPTADFEPADFERVDVFTFGDPSTLEPADAQVALGAAVKAGDAAGVTAALAAGADPDLMPDEQEPPLEEVIYAYDSLGRERQLATVDALLAGGASVHPPGRDPAICVASGRRVHMGHAMDDAWHVALLRRLLAAGADPNARATEVPFLHGNGPLPDAARQGWLAVVMLLIEAGADLPAGKAQAGPDTLPDPAAWRSVVLDALRTQGMDGPQQAALRAGVAAALAAAKAGTLDPSQIDAYADAHRAALSEYRAMKGYT